MPYYHWICDLERESYCGTDLGCMEGFWNYCKIIDFFVGFLLELPITACKFLMLQDSSSCDLGQIGEIIYMCLW
jgi:hypothetical protein